MKRTTASASLARSERIASAFMRLGRINHVAEQRQALSAAQLRLLWLLVSQDTPLTLREVGEKLNLEQSTVSRQVGAAVEAGLVHNAPTTSGPRRITATERGMDQFDDDRQGALDLYDKALADLGGDADVLLDLLDRYVAAYDAVVSPTERTGPSTL